MDEIYGISLEKLAEFGSKYSEFSAKYDEPNARAAFDQWLLTQGSSSDDYWRAYQAWLARFRADPTGQLEARHAMMVARHSQRIHFGDVRDMSQDTHEGVTLDRYAALSVAMGKPGIDPEAVAREHGLTDAAEWTRANAAWSDAMSKDTEHKLTTQFGALYQKYAGPAFAEQTMQATAAILAQANQPQDVADEPTVEQTPDLLLEKLSSASRAERWQAARRLAHAIDIGAAQGGQYRAACVPVLVDILEHHDEHTASDAEDAARRLVDIGEKTSDVRGSMARCLNRAREALTTFEAAFAPIQNSAVPERLVLRTRIDSYRSLISSLEGYLADFQESPVATFAPPAMAQAVVSRPASGGGIARLLPVGAVVLVVAAAIAFFAGRKNPSDVSLNAATASDSAAAAAAVAPTVEPPAAASAASEAAPLAKPLGKPAHGAKPKHKPRP